MSETSVWEGMISMAQVIKCMYERHKWICFATLASISSMLGGVFLVMINS